VDRSRIKTFVLLLLLLVNLSFLCVYILDSVSAARLQAEGKQELAAALSKQGIQIGAEQIPDGGRTEIYLAARDLALELALVEAVLGDAAQLNQGGGIYAYESAGGTARFQDTGDFEIRPSPGAVPATDDPAAGIGSLLLAMGLAAEPLRADEAAGTVTYVCLVDGHPVQDCLVTFTFEDSALTSIAGRRPMDTHQKQASGDLLGIGTSALIMARYISSGEQVASRVISITEGYSMSTGAYADARITPTWRIETDGGIYSVNRGTGDVTLAG